MCPRTMTDFRGEAHHRPPPPEELCYMVRANKKSAEVGLISMALLPPRVS